jgi:hypothetical protein
MKSIKIIFPVAASLLLLCSYGSKDTINKFPGLALADTSKSIVPLGGNSFITVSDKSSREKVSNDGWKNWESEKVVFSTYVKVNMAGVLTVNAVMNVPGGESTIQCIINGEAKKTTISGTDDKDYMMGSWTIAKPGYVKIDIQGLTKTGRLFGNIKNLDLSGSAVNSPPAFVKNNDGNYFYWGRRGPSVHLNYDISEAGGEIEWFYNEISVPAGNDVIGSYFMANGFGEGYFGMQVNSTSERRILFSVWSPFKTDDPKQIPDNEKIILLKKGAGVHTGEFGNEGSGGQSYLKFNWKAGNIYKFLLRGRPTGNGHTIYTAYFFAPEENKWMLIASFSRPATDTWLTRLHSFLENFDPSTGHISRQAFYQNQWIKDKSGKWRAINKATFTGDATANKGYRLDYGGGNDSNRFFLRNCGFFDDNTLLRTKLEHAAPVNMPDIDFSSLEQVSVEK